MNTTNPPQGTIRAALGYPAFRSLLAGLAVSQVGDWQYNLALVTLVYQRTGSVMWAGVATGARVLPMVILGPVGGVLADRLDRRRVMIASDLIRLLFMLALAAVAAARLPVALVPVLAALATAAGTPYLACVSGTTPRLVRDADLPGANAARSAVTSLGVMAGPALGGLLLLVGSPALAFAVNAATFGVAVACTLAIRDRGVFAVASAAGSQPGIESAASPAPRRGSRPWPLLSGAAGVVFDGIADGAAALRANPAAVRLVGADLMCSVVYGMQTIVFVLVARQDGLGLHGYGYLLAALGVGALAGTTLAGRVVRLPHRLGVALTMGLVGLTMIAMPAAHWGVVVILLAVINGAGAIMVEVMTETGLQRMLPDDVFGRAYGLAVPASLAGIVAGSLIAPVLVGALGLNGALIACGGAATGYGLLLLTRRRPALAPVALAEVS